MTTYLTTPGVQYNSQVFSVGADCHLVDDAVVPSNSKHYLVRVQRDEPDYSLLREGSEYL